MFNASFQNKSIYKNNNNHTDLQLLNGSVKLAEINGLKTTFISLTKLFI